MQKSRFFTNLTRHGLYVVLLSAVTACAPMQEPVLPVEKPEVIIQKPAVEGTVLGWVEKVKVGDISKPLKAKLDSGAKTTSINAEVVKSFKRDGKEYVLFRVGFDGEDETFEAPVVRWAKIRSKKGGKPIRRPVIEMTFCIGDEKMVEEVNLADRDHFIYPVLIGRNMLKKGDILVDSSKTFQHSASCTP